MGRATSRPAAAGTRRPPREVKKTVAVTGLASGEPARALGAMASLLVRPQSLIDALEAQLGVVQELLRGRACFVNLFDRERGQLVVSAVRGRVDDRIAAVAPAEGPTGSAFSTGVVVRAGLKSPSSISAPLLTGADRIGALTVLDPRVQAGDEVYWALAAQVAAAAEVARLRDEGARRTRDLETAVSGLRSLDRARDELLGNVSHELKTPLTTIKAYLGMALRSRLGPLDEAQRKALSVCERNSDRLLRLINDFILTSRLRSGRMTLDDRPIGLKDLCEEAVAAMSPSAQGAEVGLHLAGGQAFVRGDRERLLQAIVNLIDNGILFNRPGGNVRIGIDTQGIVARLTVSDNGAGFRGEDLPHLFNRFYWGPGDGIGRSRTSLGLSIVREIVQLHGGSVVAQSAPGEGSTFTVTLPMFAGAVSQRPALALGAALGQGVLVVEDDADCRETLREVLAAEGIPVRAAGTLSDARQQLYSERPALVLLDLRLRDGYGRELLARIRADPELFKMPVFVISGAIDAASARATGEGLERIDGFFEKPLNLPRLMDQIRSVLNESAAKNA